MGLHNLLERKKASIVQTWFDRVIGSYPPDSVQFLKSQKDQFANPVGTTTRKGLAAVFEALQQEIPQAGMAPLLDPIIRIRAIQNFTPSKALAFISDLKKVIRNELKSELQDVHLLIELSQFELKIDDLSLIAFEIYMACRETIYDLKVSTERNKIYSAFARAGLITEASDEEPGLKASLIDKSDNSTSEVG
jgi:hypothetical protein